MGSYLIDTDGISTTVLPRNMGLLSRSAVFSGCGMRHLTNISRRLTSRRLLQRPWLYVYDPLTLQHILRDNQTYDELPWYLQWVPPELGRNKALTYLAGATA